MIRIKLLKFYPRNFYTLNSLLSNELGPGLAFVIGCLGVFYLVIHYDYL